MDARWSPNGGQIAFTRVEPDGVLSAVWVVNADGSDAPSISGEPALRGVPEVVAGWPLDRLSGADRTGGTGGGRADTSYDLLDRATGRVGRPHARSGGTAGDSAGFIGQGSAWTWSTDSRQIAFVYEDTPVASDIDLMSWRSSTSHRTAGAHHGPLSGLVTGRKADRRGGSMPTLAGARQGRKTNTTYATLEALAVDSDLAWSPDGRWIAWTANEAWLSVVRRRETRNP